MSQEVKHIGPSERTTYNLLYENERTKWHILLLIKLLIVGRSAAAGASSFSPVRRTNILPLSEGSI